MEIIKLRDNLEVNCMDVPANQEVGFNFPFRILIPKNISENPEMVYACHLTQNKTKDSSTMEELIEYAKNDFGDIDPMQVHLSLEKGNPLIIPAIPRLNDFRPNFLGRDCIDNSFEFTADDKKFEQYKSMYYNLADQHKAIIECAANVLVNNGINVDGKAIISGYSEGAKFASHLALIHPEVLKCVVAGGTGGSISMPIDNIDGYEFPYPTGTSGLSNFDFNSFSDIAFFYYMGIDDKSDSAIPNFDDYHYIDESGKDCILRDECNNITPFIDENGNQVFKLDENGNYTAKFNLYTDEEVNSINKVLGTVTQNRFMKQKEIYENAGLNSFFKLYPGNHRTIFDDRKIIFEDVDNFIEQYVNNNAHTI